MTSHPPPVHSISQVAVLATLAVALLLPLAAAPAHAQTTEYRCATSVTFENRARRVFGDDISAECEGDWPHSAPFGNWGVDSNAGTRRNGFQFPGWKKQCTWIGPVPLHCDLRQWNSCTRDFSPTAYPQYYTASGYTQVPRPDNSAFHGGWPEQGSGGQTCASLGAVESFYGNHMNLLELDFNGNDVVAKLTYPNAHVPMTCDTEWDCHGSSWLSPTGGADAASADIRITVYRYRVICNNAETTSASEGPNRAIRPGVAAGRHLLLTVATQASLGSVSVHRRHYAALGAP